MPSGVRYIELRAESSARRAALTREFYEQIYRDAFPKSDQAESPDTWLPLLDDVVPEGQPRTHIVLACNADSRILGGIILNTALRAVGSPPISRYGPMPAASD